MMSDLIPRQQTELLIVDAVAEYPLSLFAIPQRYFGTMKCPGSGIMVRTILTMCKIERMQSFSHSLHASLLVAYTTV
jgi:hypothetical protein